MKYIHTILGIGLAVWLFIPDGSICFAATPTPVPTATPTVTPTPGTSPSMHIGDLDGTSAPSGSKWNATVSILVQDGNEAPVPNANVAGRWSNGA